MVVKLGIMMMNPNVKSAIKDAMNVKYLLQIVYPVKATTDPYQTTAFAPQNTMKMRNPKNA